VSLFEPTHSYNPIKEVISITGPVIDITSCYRNIAVVPTPLFRWRAAKDPLSEMMFSVRNTLTIRWTKLRNLVKLFEV